MLALDPRIDLQLDLALELSFPASDPPAISVSPPQSLKRDTLEGESE